MKDKEALVWCIGALILTRWFVVNEIGFYWALASGITALYMMRRLFRANVS